VNTAVRRFLYLRFVGNNNDAFAYATRLLPLTRSECNVGSRPKRADD
jgi:hypothetical protein